jgi:hypothetical protein
MRIPAVELVETHGPQQSIRMSVLVGFSVIQSVQRQKPSSNCLKAERKSLLEVARLGGLEMN